MGRHAAGPPADDAEPAETPSDLSPEPRTAARPEASEAGAAEAAEPPARQRGWLREVVVLAGTGAVATGAVLAWAVGAWWVAVLGAVGAAVVIVGAAWVARSVPAPGPRPERTPKVDR